MVEDRIEALEARMDVMERRLAASEGAAPALVQLPAAQAPRRAPSRPSSSARAASAPRRRDRKSTRLNSSHNA